MRIPIIASLSFSHREDLRIRSGRGRGRARGHRCAWGRRPTRLFRSIDPARLIADANGPAGGVVRRLGKEAGALPASALRPSSSSHSSTNPDEKGSVYRSDIVKILLNAAGAGRRGGARGARLRRGHSSSEKTCSPAPRGPGRRTVQHPAPAGTSPPERAMGAAPAGSPSRAPSGPGYPPAGRVAATAGVLVGDIAQTPHTAPYTAPVDPDPAAPGRPAGSAPTGVVPFTAAAAGRWLRRGSARVIPLTAAAAGVALVSSGDGPAPSSGAGRGRLPGADPAGRSGSGARPPDPGGGTGCCAVVQTTRRRRDVVAGALPTCDVASALRAQRIEER